ncbi:MAG: hypothetical protein NZT92_04415 [Abditibacteriales bacterium]|nr:hypothetical protein [Abditibacteriales bacterium]MDW8364509.1 hypothetical protein [Abditibacteriales bacterium]
MPRLTCPKCGRTYWDDEHHICLLNEPSERAAPRTVPVWVAVIPLVLFLGVVTVAAVRQMTANRPQPVFAEQPIVSSLRERKAAGAEERVDSPVAPSAPTTPQPSSPATPTVPAPRSTPDAQASADSRSDDGASTAPSTARPPMSPQEPSSPPMTAGSVPPPSVASPAPPPTAPPARPFLPPSTRVADDAAQKGLTSEPKSEAVSPAPPQLPAPQSVSPVGSITPRPQPVARTLYSTFFPLHLGESRLHFAQGHLQRMLLLYANLSHQPALQARLILDLPQDFQVEKVVIAQSPDRVRTEFTTATVRRGQETYLRCTIPMFTIPPNFKGTGANGLWDRWLGCWSYLYVTPQSPPGKYRIYWHLQSDNASEPEQSAEAEVLPPVPPAQVGQNARVGAWLYRLLDYHEDPEFEQRLLAQLYRVGIGKIALSLPPPESRPEAETLLRINRRTVTFARKQGIVTFGVNWWASWASAPRIPPTEARAVTADGRRVSAWCPSYIIERGPHFREAVKDLTESVRKMGVDGFTLDYRTAFTPQFAENDVCFCARCRHRFKTYAKIKQLISLRDVLPGGKHRRAWLDFRAWQRAEGTKALGEAVWAAKKKAIVETWTTGSGASSSDSLYVPVSLSVRKLSSRVNRVLVSTLLLPPTKADVDVAAFVRDAVHRAKPADVTVGILTAPPLNAVKASRPDINLLNYHVLSHIADGAAGIDLWGLGVLDDARYAHLISRWSTLLALCEPYIETGSKVETAAVKAAEASVRLIAYQRPSQQLVVLLNGSPKEQTVRLFPTQAGQTQTVHDLLSGKQLGTVSSGNTLRLSVAPLNAQFLTTHTPSGWQVAVRRWLGRSE